MKNTCSLLSFPVLSLVSTLLSPAVVYAQTPALPRSLHPGITVSKLLNTQQAGVRVVWHKQAQQLYYHSFSGAVFRIEQPAGGAPFEVNIAGPADHGINYLQGMAFAGSTIVLAGNFKLSGQQGYGLLVKGTPQGNGTWLWTRVMQTAPYPSSATLYDHAFSAVVVSPGGDSVYVASGSRTDHGEVEDTDGLYPNARETALTASVFKFPLHPAATIMLPNDSAAVAASGYVFCRGVRNEFDMALDSQGRLFGVENSGDRDDPEELNWLRAGRHYGFPWEMGGNQTPMQFPGYDASQDKLLSPDLSAFQRNRFFNDPAYPQKPPGLAITQPIQSSGPAATWVRNPTTGGWQALASNTTFTAHRSPLGLVFDNDSLLADFMGGAFVLAYSAGGGVRGGYLPAEDPGEDLSFVRLTYSPALAGFTATVTKVADQFIKPTDAELVGNTLYIIEEGRQAIWKLTLNQAMADVWLTGRTATLTPATNAPLTLMLTATNDGPNRASRVVVQHRLSPNVQVLPGGDLTDVGGLLTSRPTSLAPGQSVNWVYQLRPTVAGTYQQAVQVLSQNQLDPDSQPGSGSGDGQDDALLLTFRTRETGSGLFASPNPNQALLPPVSLNQPAPPAGQADLSLSVAVDNRTPVLQQMLSYTLVISNRGGATATGINIQVNLPPGLTWVSGGDFVASGLLHTPISSVAPGATARVILRAQVTGSGTLICQAQLAAATPGDPDSTPNNGYTNGEDDTARCDVRVR